MATTNNDAFGPKVAEMIANTAGELPLISDGFLAPYKVVRIGIDKDLDGWRPEIGQTDKYGNTIEDRDYNDSDYDRHLILEKRSTLVAAKITEFLRATDRFAKTIDFCEKIDHAERMRQALVNANPDLVNANITARAGGLRALSISLNFALPQKASNSALAKTHVLQTNGTRYG